MEVFKGAGSTSIQRHTMFYGERKTGNVAHCDVFSWTALISQYIKHGQPRQALRIYEEMRNRRVQPSSYTFVAALKACSSLQDIQSAKQIHYEVVKSGFDAHVYVGTMLVDVYVKCGSLVDASHVFEKMPCRNVVSWNSMILGYAQMEEGERALQLFTQMQREGVSPNDRTFVGALKACTSLMQREGVEPSDQAFVGALKAGSSLAVFEEEKRAHWTVIRKQCLEQVKAIHLQVSKMGLELDVYLGTMLVDAYAKCGRLLDARSVFDNMTQRNVVCWTAMISGYSQVDEGEEALKLYSQMLKEGVVPNERTFVGALKACSSLAAVETGDGKEVKNLSLDHVRRIHADIVKCRCESAGFVGPMLVDAYLRCESLVDARHVFEKLPHRDVVSWTAMILGYTRIDEGEIALQFYARMQQEGVAPDDRTFVAALKACSNLAALDSANKADDGKHSMTVWLEAVRAIHLEVVKSECESALYVGNMLVDSYAKCGSLVDARSVFDKMPHRDVVSWNALILAYAHMEEGNEALQLYAAMRQEGVVPDDRTFVGVLKACSSLAESEKGSKCDGVGLKIRWLEQVRVLHLEIVERELEADVFVGSMLIDAYAKCGSLVDARHIFEKLPYRNVVPWNAIISGYAQMVEGEGALQLYAQMQQEGVVPNDRTYIAALQACGCVAGLEKGREIHAQMLEAGIDATGQFVASTVIDMYGRCGSMVDAQQVFDALPSRNIVTWNALIAGYARKGDSGAVFDLLSKAKREGIQPNSITFLSVLTVCSHVGLLDEGREYFEAMSRDFGIAPALAHYSCMVDLLGRSGEVERAMVMVKAMPVQADCGVWRTVLGACQKWCNVELGRKAFEFAVRLDRNDAAAYVLMSNIYEAAHMVEDAREIQEMRTKTGAWKQPGQSWWTDTDGTMHTFLVRP